MPASLGSSIPCPAWCTLPADHAGHAFVTEGARIHYAPAPDNVHVSFNEQPTGPLDRAWYAEVIGLEMHEDTPMQLAAELRRAAADLLAAAEWLEAHQ